MKILVTGAAGFIGMHTSLALLDRGDEVVGIDNLNAYYDPNLKRARLERLTRHAKFRFERVELAERDAVSGVFAASRFDRVIHLGAQAGIRYSLENPHSYIDSNVVGFMNVLEGCRLSSVPHLVYASSSSVYGANTNMPFSEHRSVDHPLSLYAASKKANELMAHCYSHVYGLATTGLRFFTVYGPWGRPDMALFLFTEAILRGEPIQLFNQGLMRRAFTYIDDIVEGVTRVSDQCAQPNPQWSGAHPDPATSRAPYCIYNIGNHQTVELIQLVQVLEQELGVEAQKVLCPLQLGDVPATSADTEELCRAVGFVPSTSIEEGIRRFVQWYLDYHGLKRADLARRAAGLRPAI